MGTPTIQRVRKSFGSRFESDRSFFLLVRLLWIGGFQQRRFEVGLGILNKVAEGDSFLVSIRLNEPGAHFVNDETVFWSVAGFIRIRRWNFDANRCDHGDFCCRRQLVERFWRGSHVGQSLAVVKVKRFCGRGNMLWRERASF